MKSRLLLDSRVAIWFFKEPERIGRTAKELIMQAQEVYVSAASVWELNLKHSRGKLPDMPGPLSMAIKQSGFLPLAITIAHSEAVISTYIPHKDPFDQLLLAQARAEHLTLLTADHNLLTQSGTMDARL